MSATNLAEIRRQKDLFFKTHPQSPLTDRQRETFSSLSYYPYNPALDLHVAVTPFAQQQPVPIQTTTGDVRQYLRYGEFMFEVDGEQARLTIYETPHGFFLPFVDASAGTETYPAGRYLDLEPEDAHATRFHVDFNQAYNPYCAYSDRWNCPITPAENRLKVAIRAGEKLPQGAWLGQS